MEEAKAAKSQQRGNKGGGGGRTLQRGRQTNERCESATRRRNVREGQKREWIR